MIRIGLQKNVETLRGEIEKCRKQLLGVNQRQIHLQDTLLRLQDAMQALDEMLVEDVPRETAEVHSRISTAGRRIW